MKVKATEMYKKLNLKDKELGRIPEVGEVFEVTKERYKVLTETNKHKVAFVEKVEETKKVEKATKKVKAETATKKVKEEDK